LWELARKRTRSERDYLEFQRFQGILLIRNLKGRGIGLNGKSILDLGCGLGGYSLAFDQEGGRVTALDLRVPEQMEDGPPVRFVQGNALSMPFSEASFDFVFCASLIEHVEEPTELLAQILRVLRPSGICYLSFPPFWTPVGGHQFSPFHLLGERLGLKIYNSQLGRRIKRPAFVSFSEKPASCAELCCDFGLYPVTIGQVKATLAQLGAQIFWMGTKFSPLNLARLPLLNEFLTWHVEFIWRKSLSTEDSGARVQRWGSFSRDRANGMAPDASDVLTDRRLERLTEMGQYGDLKRAGTLCPSTVIDEDMAWASYEAKDYLIEGIKSSL